MTQTVAKKLNDSFVARWTALVLVASMMFFAYMFVDVMSPLKSLVEETRGWDSATFGMYASSEFFLNVFVFFLIFAGIILDKMGIRFTGLLSASLMVLGAGIKYVGISDWFQTTALCEWLNSWWVAFPGSAKMASLGFMIFGCGCEMAGTTVSKAIAKWFQGKEMALAMGLEMAIARLGVFAVMWIAPMISEAYDRSIVAPVAFCSALLVIGLLSYTVFVYMDKALDKQLIAAGEMKEEKSSDEEFQLKDLGKIFTSKMFWLVALLCVLYYSAIFPFQRYAPNFIEVTLGISAEQASRLFSFFPILAMCLTPVLGGLLDFKGKGATMLMVGSVVMCLCHLSFALLLPIYPSKVLALLLIVTLGVSFSLVPAALWPSVPKIIDEKILGSAYCVIFWIQNIGLCLTPLLIGKVLTATGGYRIPMLIFSMFGVAAFIFSFYLKIEDRRKGYGLELPNVKKPLKPTKKIGRLGSEINDVGSALDDIENQYKHFHRMLYDEDYGFGHFLALNDHHKEMILSPLKQISECRKLHFSRISNDGTQFSLHYNFYLGELDQNNKRRFGVYSWECEKDEDGDTSIDYFVGSFENERPKDGVWYHLSNEDAKIWVNVDGQFRISAKDGVEYYN